MLVPAAPLAVLFCELSIRLVVAGQPDADHISYRLEKQPALVERVVVIDLDWEEVAIKANRSHFSVTALL